MKIARIDRARGCLLGLAAGDAVGTAVEFRPRGSFEPVTGMTGGGPFGLDPGRWTDDTSLALCLAESLADPVPGRPRGMRGFDPADQLRRYVRWFREGHLSSTGQCFDIGTTTRTALRRFEGTGEPFSGSTDPGASGNGSIMRLAPVALFFHPDAEQAIRFAGESSRTTHGARECVDACRLLAAVLCRALDGRPKGEVLEGGVPGLCRPIREIALGGYAGKTETEIRGSGYVVESLEAALWCFRNTDSFREAILRAVNLGDDADTTAAVCGQVAGACYGESGIPPDWLARLHMADRIRRFADRLAGHAPD